MATFTSNYAWTKPAGSDPVDIGVLNNNLDDQDSTIHDAFLNMAPPFSESSTYAVDDIVLYGTKTYKCRVPVTTPGSWTGATNWDEYKLSELTDEIANKVDKVTGKGLSTNDYTNTDKAEVAKVANKADKTATTSGETLALVPTSEGRALIHTAYGMSVQNGTPTPSSPVDIVSAKVNLTSTHGQDSHNVTTGLTLRAIEVSSSDAYNLVRDGKYYIADTLDYSENNGFVVTRRVGIVNVDAASWYKDWGNDTAQFNFTPSDLAVGLRAYCNRFIRQWQSTPNTNEFWVTDLGGFVFIIVDSAVTSIATATAWLTNNPTYVVYALRTTITETITTEQALALLGLKTYDESTTISSQAEPACTIAVEYAKERLGALALTAYNTAKGNDLRITALEG